MCSQRVLNKFVRLCIQLKITFSFFQIKLFAAYEENKDNHRMMKQKLELSNAYLQLIRLLLETKSNAIKFYLSTGELHAGERTKD